ncbi:Ribonuclease G [bacterium HR30]|nr:Ribonuclease G [bacterium HR30]
MRELLLEFSYFELRGALVEDGELVELSIESVPEEPLRPGDIFWARVIKLMPELRGAMVDLGPARGFLQARNFPECLTMLSVPGPSVEQCSSYVPNRLREGLELPVQVRKLPRDEKAALVTSRIVIDGFFLSFRPGWPEVSWPWQVPRDVRERIAATTRSILGKHDGFAAHLRSIFASPTELLAELERLRQTWLMIAWRLKESANPGLVYRTSDPFTRILQEIAHPELDAVYVDGPESLCERVKAAWSQLTLERPVPMLQYSGKEALFVERRLEQQIEQALGVEVPLPNGGQLLFETTAGGTIVDVNSPGLGQALIRDAANPGIDHRMNVNLQAARAIATQVRLRGCAGSIVVDLINTFRDKERRRFARSISECFRNDPWVRALYLHDHGALLHIQREYHRPSLAELLLDPCPHCGAANRIPTLRTRARNLLRLAMQKLRLAPKAAKIVADVPAELLNYFHQNEPCLVSGFATATGIPLELHLAQQCEPQIRIIEAN